MTRVANLFAAIAVVTAVHGCNRRPDDSAAGAGEVVAALNARLDSAYRRGNADSVVVLMTDSVVISAEGVPDLRGRAAVRELLSQFFEGSTVAAFTLQPTELQVHGDHAYERGTFAWTAGPTNGVQTRRSGRYSVVRLRQPDGAWPIHRYLENSLPTPR